MTPPARSLLNELLRKAPLLRRRILLLLIAGVPLLFLRIAYDPVNVPKLSLLTAGVGVVLGLRVAEMVLKVDARSLKRLMVPAFALGGVLIVGWLFSPYKSWALFGHYPRFTGLIPYLVAILFGVLVADAFAGRAIQIAWALMGAGGVAGMYALIQRVGLDPFSWSVKGSEAEVVASTLGNANFAGAFLAIVIPIGIGVWASDPARRRWSVPLIGLAVIGCGATSSQIAWVAALAGIAIVAGALMVERWRFAPLVGAVAAVTILLAVVGTIAATSVFGPSSMVPDTIERRGEWWKAAVAMSADSPLVGRGPGAFAVEHSRYRTLDDARQVNFDITDDPHSTFLSFLTGAGAIGGIGFLVGMTWIARVGWTSRGEVLAAAFFGGTVAYTIQSLASVDTIALRVAFWSVVAGLVTSRLSLDDQRPKRPVKGRRTRSSRDESVKRLPLIVVGAGIALGGFWWSFGALQSDVRFLSGQNELTDGEVQTGQQHVEEAIAFRGEYVYRREYGRDLGAVSIALAEAGEVEIAQTFRSDAEEAFGYTEDFPHSNSIVDYARFLRDWNSYDSSTGPRAVDLYARAARLDPRNRALLSEASDFAVSIRSYRDVVNIIRPSVEEIGDAGLWGRLALAYAHLGEDQLAQEAIDRTLELAPEDPVAAKAQAVLSRGN